LTPGRHSRDDYGDELIVDCDVAVIGAGPGGSGVTAALAEAGLKVALFDAGKHWKPREFSQDNRVVLRELYADRGNRVALGNGVLPINGGVGVGGSSLINSAISFRTPTDLVDLWRDQLGFDPEGHYEDLVERVITTLGVGVNPFQVQGRNNTIFAEGVEKLGWEGGAFMPRSAPGCVGCGVCQLGCPSGGKWSADRTFLAQAELTGLVGTYASCRAEGAVVEGGVIRSVVGSLIDPESQKPNGTWRVNARAVVLSMGSINTPRFLLFNGLDASPLVGHNLGFHPGSSVTAAFDEPIRHWSGVSQGYYVNRRDTEGFLIETATVTPDAHFIGVSLELGEELNQVMADLPNMALAGAMVWDQDTVAQVTKRGVRLQFGEGDRKRVLTGLRRTAEVYFAAGARYVVPGVAGIGIIRDAKDIDARISLDIPFSRIMAISSHPMATCQFGLDPELSVTSPRGRVWGMDNLYVADASLFPSSLGVNPQVTVYSLALLVGQHLAESLLD
jgi:choline dehydrogenase-like flavoprotein